MTTTRRNWIITIAVAAGVVIAALVIAGSVLTKRIEPYARQVAVQYLSQRFDADVQLEALHIRIPKMSPLHLMLTRGRGISARVEGENLLLRLHRRPGAAPLFEIRNFRGDVELSSLLKPPAMVSEILVEGMKIQVPPRSDQPQEVSGPQSEKPADKEATQNARVRFDSITIRNADLVLLAKDPRKLPLHFAIQSLHLTPGADMAMNYQASLTNAKPPGQIEAKGAFGPWQVGEPGETPVNGEYLFDKADLGVFRGIAGTLHSTGRFDGRLAALTVRGQASVPNFRLRTSGNPVPLFAQFTTLVDGTNGNTILQPVSARLGSTNFTTSGGIIKHEANQPRAISLNVSMPNGNLRDVLRLAMKGEPFMAGRLVLHTKLDIPPLAEKVRDKLELDGHFEIQDGKFLHSTIQNQIDGLSKRARGEGGNPDAGTAISQMSGEFHLENADMQFRKLSFGVPGAILNLAGNYNLDSDALDFDGSIRLQATVSQLVTGWKRVLLKPVDPFFEKGGAGTFLHIRIEGTSKAPKFGVIVAGKKLEAPLPKHK